MSTAKQIILERIRRALPDVPQDLSPEEDSPVDWEYGQYVEVGNIVDVFDERVVDYKATVVRSAEADVPQAIVDAMKTLEASSVVIPHGLDQAWADALKAEFEVSVDGPGNALENLELNAIDAVVTASAVSSAETGTIMLDHSADQGRRAITLVPDIHIVVVRTDQIVSSVPEAVARLKENVVAGQPFTWISGGSATSDIELSRVEGVHGPRTLYVIIAE